jgi:hypothetical protein
MDELLARILDAHGGLDRWNGYEKIQATLKRRRLLSHGARKMISASKASGDPDQPKGAA